MKEIYHVAILEPYLLYGQGIKSMLSESEELQIICVAKKADELIENISEKKPYIVVIDILHCDNAGLKILKKIRRLFPHLPILLITGSQYADCVREQINLGVNGFIFHNASPDELKKAVIQLSMGGRYFRKKIWKKFKETIQLTNPNEAHPQNEHILTDREITVLKLFCGGLSYKEIGNKLFISPRTVETHKKNILSKLKIKSTAEMVKYAFHNQIFN
jgi:DNA-binding NarL/FixJ family response regulator